MSSTALLITDIRIKLVSSIGFVFLLLGSVGNVLNIFLFTKRGFWELSPGIPYLLAACIANIIDIYTYVLLRVLGGFNISPSSYVSIVCKLQMVVHYTAFGLSSWFMVACCANRFFSSSRNVTIRSYSNMRMTGRVMLVTAIIIPLIYMQVLYCFEANQTTKPAPCFPQNDICNAFDIIFYFVFQAIGLPVLMFIFGIGIFIHLRQGRQVAQGLKNRKVGEGPITFTTTTTKSAKRNDRSVLAMIAIQATVYIICSAPLLAIKVYSIMPISTDKSAVQISVENLIHQISILFSLVDKIFSFYIYTLASKYYRTELVKLVTRCWSQNRVAPQH